MPIRKTMKTLPKEWLAARGLMHHDWEAVTACQMECMGRLGISIQMEQESYLSNHPEVKAMVELFIAKMASSTKKNANYMKEAADYFLRSVEELDFEIRTRLKVPRRGPYTKTDIPIYHHYDRDLANDLNSIITKHYPRKPCEVPTPSVSSLATLSSSFLSVPTSDTTLPTPDPIPTPEPTLSEIMLALVSNTVDKAIYLHVDEELLRYDTAYVELSKAVETAMEIPVIEIRDDIAELFYNAYKMFELDIIEKERAAAELAWERRMRKKMKRTLRRVNNFRGYETPPTPKSQVSSHESYKKPPHKPCICHPQYEYNRYPKDRFGIYLPRPEHYSDGNITATPTISVEALEIASDEDTKSIKSAISKKSWSPKGSKTRDKQ